MMSDTTSSPVTLDQTITAQINQCVKQISSRLHVLKNAGWDINALSQIADSLQSGIKRVQINASHSNVQVILDLLNLLQFCVISAKLPDDLTQYRIFDAIERIIGKSSSDDQKADTSHQSQSNSSDAMLSIGSIDSVVTINPVAHQQGNASLQDAAVTDGDMFKVIDMSQFDYSNLNNNNDFVDDWSLSYTRSVNLSDVGASQPNLQDYSPFTNVDEDESAYRILIIEDDRAQALFAESVLNSAGMQTQVASDDLQALATLHAFRPELILMDLHLPGIDGMTLMKQIHQLPGYTYLPVVFLSGDTDENTQFAALAQGGDDFHTKPIRPKHLIATVQNRVQRYRKLRLQESTADITLRHRRTQIYLYGEISSASALTRIARRIHAGITTGAVIRVGLHDGQSLHQQLGAIDYEACITAMLENILRISAPLSGCRMSDGSILVLVDERDDEALSALASQLRDIAVVPATLKQASVRVAVSVCLYSSGYASADALLSESADGLAKARSLPERIYIQTTGQLADIGTDKVTDPLLDELLSAADESRLTMVYQPIVAIAGGDMSQYQALLRMRTRGGDWLPAAGFIQRASEHDAIISLDRWAITTAIRQIKAAAGQGHLIRLFASPSIKTVLSPNQCDWLFVTLDKYDVKSVYLGIEISMTDAIAAATQLKDILLKITARGISVCMSRCRLLPQLDQLLDDLPLSMIKLDPMYSIAKIDTSQQQELRNIVDAAHQHGLEVIGHGVEAAQGAATLWASGIDFIQGNFVQQPQAELDFDFQQAVI